MEAQSDSGDKAHAKREGRKVLFLVMAIFTTVSVIFLSLGLYFILTNDKPVGFEAPMVAFPWVMMTMMAIFGLAHRAKPAVGSSSDWQHDGEATWVAPHRSRAGYFKGKARGWNGEATVEIDSQLYPAITLGSSLVLDAILIALCVLNLTTLGGMAFGLVVSYFLKHMAWLMRKDLRKKEVAAHARR